MSDFETAYEELKNAQEKRLQEAIRDAQDKARLQYITEVEELRQEAALEISLQRHSYEDEIATLNRVIQDRQSDDISSPSIVSSSVQNWEEIKIFIQDAENRLRQPKESTLEVRNLNKKITSISLEFFLKTRNLLSKLIQF